MSVSVVNLSQKKREIEQTQRIRKEIKLRAHINDMKAKTPIQMINIKIDKFSGKLIQVKKKDNINKE